MLQVNITENHDPRFRPGPEGFQNVQLGAKVFVPIQVKRGQAVNIVPQKGNSGWTHDRHHVSKYGPEGHSAVPPVAKEYFARSTMPIGSLVGGYDIQYYNTIDLKLWQKIFQQAVHKPVDFGGGRHYFEAPITGFLYLIMNDALYWPGNVNNDGYEDNDGNINIEINVD
jgi:hypothetical protein